MRHTRIIMMASVGGSIGSSFPIAAIKNLVSGFCYTRILHPVY
jgi:hypothetical protein